MKNRQNRPIGAAVWIALCGLVAPCSAQEGMLASLDRMPVLEQPERVVEDAPRTTLRPITDDGRNGDALVPTGQLLIGLSKEERCDLQVEVLSEAGRCMRSWAFADVGPRSAIPVSVADLPQGRYVLRISGGATRVVRFVR